MICSSEHHWPYLPNTVHLLLGEKRMLRVILALLATETFVGVDWGKKRAVASGTALKFFIVYRYRNTIVFGYQLTTSNVSLKMKNNSVLWRATYRVEQRSEMLMCNAWIFYCTFFKNYNNSFDQKHGITVTSILFLSSFILKFVIENSFETVFIYGI